MIFMLAAHLVPLKHSDSDDNEQEKTDGIFNKLKQSQHVNTVEWCKKPHEKMRYTKRQPHTKIPLL